VNVAVVAGSFVPSPGLIIEAGTVLVGGFTNSGIVADVAKDPLVAVTVKLYVVAVDTVGTYTDKIDIPGAVIVDGPILTLLPDGRAGVLDTERLT
jgi:hypothetical protein